MLDQKKVDEVRDYLIGSSARESDAANLFDIDDNDILDYIIEAKIECCAQCGWWYDSDEMNEKDADLICDDCNNE